jgi:aryl-phospho-beta-D-glucosidase BglC (GH1 family)
MNTVRIPIGYWAFENQGTPYVKGAADYLAKQLIGRGKQILH